MNLVVSPCRFVAGLIVAISFAEQCYAQFTITQIAVTGSPVPGATDMAEFAGFGAPPSINSAGDVAFRAELRTGAGPEVTRLNDEVIVGPTAGPGSLFGIIVREDELPGADPVPRTNTLEEPALNELGEVAFIRNGPGPGASAPRGNALFAPTAGAGSALGIVARENDPAPGTADLADFSTLSFPSLPSLNIAGDVAFVAPLRTGDGAPVLFAGPDSNDEGLFGPTSGPNSPLGLILRENDPAPGATDAAEIARFFRPALNDSGDVAVVTQLRTGSGPAVTDNFAAILGPTGGPNSSLGIRVRTQDSAPGTSDGAVITSLSSTAINNAGDIAFEALLGTGTGAEVTSDNSEAIFGPSAGPGSPLGLVAREGGIAPTDDFAEFSSFGVDRGPALNSAGDVAFRAVLRTGVGAAVTADNNVGVFASVDGELRLILRKGDILPVEAPGGLFDDRAIRDFSVSPSGLSDDGLLAVQLIFDDGSLGVFTVDTRRIPEPTAVLLMSLGSAVLRLSWRP